MYGVIMKVDKWDGIKTELKITGINGVFYKLEMLHTDRIARRLFVGACVRFDRDNLSGVVSVDTKECKHGIGHGDVNTKPPKDIIPIP